MTIMLSGEKMLYKILFYLIKKEVLKKQIQDDQDKLMLIETQLMEEIEAALKKFNDL